MEVNQSQSKIVIRPSKRCMKMSEAHLEMNERFSIIQIKTGKEF